MKADFETRLNAALQSLRARADFAPDYGLIMGTGLGALTQTLTNVTQIPYEQIEAFPHTTTLNSTLLGHEGALYFGTLASKSVAIFSGRFHLYEGWEPDDIVLPVYLLKALGAKGLFITNAAGSLNPDFAVGDLCLIEDHINFQGAHALTGPNIAALGVRFPDLSQVYTHRLRRCIQEAAKTSDTRLHSAVYGAVHGPELETNAERRFYRKAGADIVGMSTLMEVVAAAHAQLPHAALSVITNMATGEPGQEPDTIENILARSAQALPRLQQLLHDILETL